MNPVEIAAIAVVGVNAALITLVFQHLRRERELRDVFAGQALTSIGNGYVAFGDVNEQAKQHAATLAAHAYSIADAMLAARKGGAE